MKKIIAEALIIGSFLICIPDYSKADNTIITNYKTSTLILDKKQQAQLLLNRLDEINSIDKSNLNSSEKRGLRKEVRQIKSQLRELSGGIYLSAGAVIIILLLLIILL